MGSHQTMRLDNGIQTLLWGDRWVCNVLHCKHCCKKLGKRHEDYAGNSGCYFTPCSRCQPIVGSNTIMQGRARLLFGKLRSTRHQRCRGVPRRLRSGNENRPLASTSCHQ